MKGTTTYRPIMPPKGSPRSLSNLPCQEHCQSLTSTHSLVTEPSQGTAAGVDQPRVASPSTSQEPYVKNTHRVDSDDETTTTAAENARLLKEAREAAHGLPGDSYLGVASVRAGLTWHKDGRRHRLVSIDALTEANANDDVPCAMLSLIVHITKRDCWLAPDASWAAATSYGKKFVDIKLTFQGCAPSDSQLTQEFNVGVGNLTYFMNLIQTEGADQMRILSQHLSGQKVKFRHAPFIVSTYSLTWGWRLMTHPTANQHF